MLDEHITNVRKAIEGSLADIEQPWDYYIRVCYKLGNKTYTLKFYGGIEGGYDEEEIEIQNDEERSDENEH